MPQETPSWHVLLLLCSIFTVALALLLGACRPREGEVTIADENEPLALYFERLGRGANAALTDTTEQAIRDSAAWAVLTPQLRATETFAPVDFSQSMVLLAAVPAPSGGYIVEIDAVEATPESLLVSYTLVVPGEDCLAPQQASVPYEAVVSVRDERPARFTRRTQRLACSL